MYFIYKELYYFKMKKLLWIVFLAFLINENAYSKDSFKSKLSGKELDYLAQCRTEDNKIQMFGFNSYSTKEMKTNAPKTLKKYPLDYFGTFHQSGKGKNYAGAAYAVFTKNPDVWTWVSGGVSKKKEKFIISYRFFNDEKLSKKNAKVETIIKFFNEKKIDDIAYELAIIRKESFTENIVETPDDYLMKQMNAHILVMADVKMPKTQEEVEKIVNKGGYFYINDLNCTKL